MSRRKEVSVERLKELSVGLKDELIADIEQTAFDNERVYRGCGRSVLCALQTHLGLESSAVIKAATALGGGVGRTGEVCGALLGGLMAIGLVYASDRLDDARTSPAYQETTTRAMKLTDRFRKEFGGLRCRDVHRGLFGRHYDLRNPEDVQEFRKSDYTKCEDVVCRNAARLAAEVILELCEGRKL